MQEKPRKSQSMRLLRRWKVSEGAPQLGLLLFALAALLPDMPALQRTPGNASSIFLYTGAQIIKGLVPYRDIWVNAPPLLFYFNALGLALGGMPRWGIWLLELVLIFSAVLLLHNFLKRYFGGLPAFVGAVGFLVSLVFVLERGNLPGEYGLLFQALIYAWLPGLFSAGDKRRWPAVFLGGVIGLAASLNLPLLSLGLIVMLFLLALVLFSRQLSRLIDLGWLALGFFLVWAAWFGFFAANHALGAFVDQVFRYGLLSLRVSNPQRIQALVGMVNNLSHLSAYFYLGFLTWLVLVPFLIYNEPQFREGLAGRAVGGIFAALGILMILNGVWDDRSGRLTALTALSVYRLGMVIVGLTSALIALFFLTGWVARQVRGFFSPSSSSPYSGRMLPLAVVLIDLPVELVLASLTGQSIEHYFLPLLVPLAVLTAFLFWSLLRAGMDHSQQRIAYVWAAVLALPLLGMGGVATVRAIQSFESTEVTQAADFIHQNTAPGEPILQWGMNPRLYFVSERTVTGKYIDQQALFTAGYASAPLIQAYLAQLQKESPVYIIDTRSEAMPLPISRGVDCTLLDSDAGVEKIIRSERDARYIWSHDEPLPYYPVQLKALYRWMCDNYEQVSPGDQNQDQDAWRIYHLRKKQP
jgi:hypothetical protein